MDNTKITVQITVSATIEKAWKCWTTPNDIMQWNHASDDWHTTNVVNDLKEGGKFQYRMEAKDGSFGFDFGGTYDTVSTNEIIEYTLDDNRKVSIRFSSNGHETTIIQTFEAETENTVELQQFGWQSIMNYYKKHTEKP